MAPPGNQAANREDKAQPAHRKQPAYSPDSKALATRTSHNTTEASDRESQIASLTPSVFSATKFVYDAWNIIAELDGNNGLIRSHTWCGPGARGIACLLLITEGANKYQVGHDGMGNVALMVSTTTGAVVASYDYNAFGETIRATGQYAATNPFRFGSKYTDPESGLIYYGYRFYNPSTGSWISKDPREEQGGSNLYSFVGNDAVNHLDALGLTRVRVTASAFIPWSWVKIAEPPH